MAKNKRHCWGDKALGRLFFSQFYALIIYALVLNSACATPYLLFVFEHRCTVVNIMIVSRGPDSAVLPIFCAGILFY